MLSPTHDRPEAAVREQVRLLGQPHLSDYLEFVKTRVVGGEEISPRTLADEWRDANDVYYELEREQGGSADEIECDVLDPALAPLAANVMEHRRLARSFDELPTWIGMVELDRLIISQPYITRDFTSAIAGRLGPDPAPEALFRFCLPLDRRNPAVRAERLSSDRYLFSSESTDFRSHSAVLLNRDQIDACDASGTAAAMIALGIGFGSNFLLAIRSDKRILLQNGYHRAYALRSLGISRAPIIIQDVTRRDELKLIAGDNVCENPEFYFGAARPPLLMDFFDSRLHKVYPVRPMRTLVEVEIKVRQMTAIE